MCYFINVSHLLSGYYNKYKMKRNVFFLIFIICCYNISAQIKNNLFSLNGIISSDYKGYIYLSYNKVKDSCLVLNGKFKFNGQLKSEALAYFTTNKPTSMVKDFYLENKNINMAISILTKTINNVDIDFVDINSISGTNISLIEKEYDFYKKNYENDKYQQTKYYNYLNNLVEKYPKNIFIVDLLTRESWDSLSNRKKLQKLYKKLDLKYHSKSSLLTLKNNIFPITKSIVRKKMFDFVLPNENGKGISTTKYRGKILLIDFWASWCVPCRKQIPELKKISEKFHDKNFKILSISIDDSKEKWMSALLKEKMEWENVIEMKAFSTTVVDNYEVKSIPKTFLINENGIIIGIDLSITELEEEISKLFKDKK